MKMKMKQLLYVVLVISLFIQLQPLVHADEDIDFNEMFAGAVVLSIGSANAISDNTDLMIDENNFRITPFIKNQTTLVPLRFISENMGAGVAWDSKSSTATITKGSKKIQITLGSSKLKINGLSYPLAAPAQYKEGRIFVPLRVISEAFGKKVFYEGGIIVISDKAIPQLGQNKELIDYLRIVLAPFDKDPYTGRTLSVEQIAKLEQSVVLLESFDREGASLGFGTAFAVGYGLFLTNYHVIADSSSYLIQTGQDRYYDVDGVVAYNEEADLAIVKTSIRTNIPPLRIGSSLKLAKGQAVVAIGNPEGLQNTVSTGIVSGIRTMGADRLIQITAPITNGSSGGPLFNRIGEVIGINTMGAEQGNLNFSVPIEYAGSWISVYSKKSFANIQVLNQDQFREQEPTEPEQQPDEATAPPTPTEPIEEPSTIPVTPEESIHPLPFIVREAVVDPAKPVVYAVNESESKIVAYNYSENKSTAVSEIFNRPPRKLYYANGELYAIIANADYSPYRFDEVQGGKVVVLDPATLQVKDQWNVRIDPYDMVVDRKGHVVVASGSGQWTEIISYDRRTKAELSAASIRNASTITLHPAEDRIYAVNSDSSPRDMEMFSLNEGIVTKGHDSPYHGEYELSTVIGLTPDGQYLLNGYGGVFTATNNRESNMQHAGRINSFDVMTSDPARKDLFFSGKGQTISQYDTATLKVTRNFRSKGTIIELLQSGNKLVAITKIINAGAPKPQYAVEEIL
ncbi:MAG: stalk domain-containing protein [Bacillota bacterium]